MQCFVKKLIIKFLGKRERERVAVIPAQAGIQSFLNSGFRLLGRNDRAFTLIELLVVITILSILATVVLLVINPAQMIKQSRDATRISDMETISKAILVFQSSGTSALSMGSSNTIYVSVPSASAPLCTDLNLSAPPSGWAHACSTSANNRKTNGTGWIPIDFSSSPFGSLLATLPIDPSNATSTGLYYTYINGSFALSATLESTKYLASSAANDKGQSSTRFELGSNLALNVNLLAAATAPTNIVLEIGSTAPVGGVTNVAIPVAGATDTTGAVTGWVTTTADKIKFTVTDGGSAVSTITIGGGAYTSGANYTILSTASLSIVVTTTESGKTTGVRTFTVTVAASTFSATGGTITEVGGYRIHTFTTSGTFTPDSSGNVDYLVVGGGGGGGAQSGGGGGAGGFRTGTGFAVTAQAYTVTVGNGGVGTVTGFSSGTSANGVNGQGSVFSTITAAEGGGGGGYRFGSAGANGSSGGSGGGGGAADTSPYVGTGGAGNTPLISPLQGNNGGNSGGGWPAYGAGGGGGASAAGNDGTTSVGGNGGAGTASSISGSSVTYAGGGGGGIYSAGTAGVGGAGGGGSGVQGANATNGTTNTGGGGGGGGLINYNGGNGGSGIVIVRYPL